MPLLATLKSATAQQHAALENGLDLFRRAGTSGGYRQLLEDFYTLYQPLEDLLAGAQDWPARGWDFNSRRKTPWLVRDLRVLGEGLSTARPPATAADLPALHSAGAAVGCLYVLEGSTLGGQFISRHLNTTLGVTPATGGCFFAGYGPDTAAQWRRFGLWAEDQAADQPHFEADAVMAAKSTFDCFSRWFQTQSAPLS